MVRLKSCLVNIAHIIYDNEKCFIFYFVNFQVRHNSPFMINTDLRYVKAIYIRLGDWSFLNGGKTNFVEVFQH